MCISDYSNISAIQRGQSDSLENASKFDELWLRTQQIAKILEAKVPFGKGKTAVLGGGPERSRSFRRISRCVHINRAFLCVFCVVPQREALRQ